MSGKPFITYTVPALWATDANYAAGIYDWSGQPTKVTPPSYLQGFVPNQGAAPEYVNQLFSDVHISLAAIKAFQQTESDYVANMAALNWSREASTWRTLISGGTHMGCEGGVYSDRMKSWFAVISDPGNSRMYFASAVDPLGTWASLGFVSSGGPQAYVSPPVCLLASNLSIAAFNVAAAQLKFVATSGGAPSVVSPASLAAAGSVSSGLTSCFFNGQALFFTALGADLGTIINTPDGSTFTKTSFSTNAGRAWFTVAASPSICVAACAYYVGATDIRFQTSTNGTTWSASSISSPHSGSGESPRGICYSAGSGLFTLITENNAGNGVHYTYTSPDGTTWTYVSTFTVSELGANYHVSSVAACGSLLVASFPTTLATTRICFSPDAGVTWNYRSDIVDEPNDSATASNAILGQVVASGDRFLLFTELGLRVSLRAGIGESLTL